MIINQYITAYYFYTLLGVYALKTKRMTNIPDYFYDKELCDAIRDIAKYSTTTVEDAELYMKYSTDYERDSFIVKKLANVGMSKNNILTEIKNETVIYKPSR